MDQKGMTLIEVLVATAIAGVLMNVAVPSVYQVIRGTSSTNTQLTALHDIENAADRIISDGHMAQTTDLVEGAAPVDSLTLSWTDWYDSASVSHSVSYYLEGSKLRRDYDGTLATVAYYISDIEFSLSERVIKVSITSSPEGEQWPSKERTYLIYLRPVAESPVK